MSPISSGRKLQLALIQLAVGSSKSDNLAKAASKVAEAAKKGAQLVALPECFNSPYGHDFFGEYAEPIPGDSSKKLSSIAKENNIYLIGGSIPERDGDKLYNTCTVWGPQGDLLAKFRKIHLFDINIPGGITFQESKTLTAGNNFATFDLLGFKVGVGICYDIRFAEMAQLYARKGCQLLVYPGAFNMTTGPLHWELLMKARAVDNQVYVATVSPARDTSASYVAWGHSSVADPMGKVIATTDEQEGIIYSELDLDYMNQVRTMIPVTIQRRKDLYDVIKKTEEVINLAK